MIGDSTCLKDEVAVAFDQRIYRMIIRRQEKAPDPFYPLRVHPQIAWAKLRALQLETAETAGS
jgi:hypothetical protein